MAINFSCRTGARTPSCDRAWPGPCSRRSEPASRPRPAADLAVPEVGKRRADGDGGPKARDGSLRRVAQADATPFLPGRLMPFRTHLAYPQNKGRQIALPPRQSGENNLLEVGHRGKVSRELHDAGCAAPVGAEPAGMIAVTKDGLKLVVL